MQAASEFTTEELEVRARITQQILDEVKRADRQRRVDLFLGYFYNSHFNPAGFDELRQLGVASVNFYCNSIYQFAQVAAIAAKVDFAWHPEKSAREFYLRVGAKPVWVQMAADPELCHPVEGVERKRAACFIGQRYADRDRCLAALHDAHLPFDIYGAGWDSTIETAEDIAPREEVYLGRKQYRPGSYASYAHTIRENIESDGLIGGLSRTAEQMRYRRKTHRLTPQIAAHAKGKAENIATTLAAYEVCLNFSNVWADGRPGSALIPHVRLRDFEAPMCRTCYITGHSDEIGESYEIGREIDTYGTAGELVDKTKFYLNNPIVAERLRTAGYERARRDHTWVKRFGELFRKIGLNN